MSPESVAAANDEVLVAPDVETPQLAPTRKRHQEDVPEMRKKMRGADGDGMEGSTEAAVEDAAVDAVAQDNVAQDAVAENVAAPTAVAAVSEPRVVLDWKAFPHIFDRVLDYIVLYNYLDPARTHRTLLALRSMNKELCDRIDELFCSHIIVYGEKENGVFSKYGRIPNLKTAHPKGKHKCRTLDIVQNPADCANLPSVPTPVPVILDEDGAEEFWQSFEVIRQMAWQDTELATLLLLRHIVPQDMNNVRKVVRFINTQMDWSGPRIRPPDSAVKYVVNIWYTRNWPGWSGAFFGSMNFGCVKELVFIFEEGDPKEPSSEWFFRRGSPYGVLTPLMETLAEEQATVYIHADRIYDITFVGFPDIPPRFAGLNWNGHGSEEEEDPNFTAFPDPELLKLTGREIIMKRYSEAINGPENSRIPEDKRKLMEKITFLSRDTYNMQCTRQEHEDEFWFSSSRIAHEVGPDWDEKEIDTSHGDYSDFEDGSDDSGVEDDSDDVGVEDGSDDLGVEDGSEEDADGGAEGQSIEEGGGEDEGAKFNAE